MGCCIYSNVYGMLYLWFVWDVMKSLAYLSFEFFFFFFLVLFMSLIVLFS